MIAPGTLFEELGFNYIGPIDGHDLPLLIETLENIRELSGPQFLHIVTTKGKGFAPAEADPIGYHAINKIEPMAATTVASGNPTPVKSGPVAPKYANVFGQWLCDAAAADERVMGITPAMCEGSDLLAFAERFPARYFDVAIAEQHAVTWPPAWPVMAPNRWSPSTPLSYSVVTISLSTMSPFRIWTAICH